MQPCSWSLFQFYIVPNYSVTWNILLFILSIVNTVVFLFKELINRHEPFYQNTFKESSSWYYDQLFGISIVTWICLPIALLGFCLTCCCSLCCFLSIFAGVLKGIYYWKPKMTKNDQNIGKTVENKLRETFQLKNENRRNRPRRHRPRIRDCSNRDC